MIGARRILCLDWDWLTLRIVHAQVGRRPRVLSALSVQVPPGLAYGNAEALGEFIREVLRQQRIRTRRAVVDIPRDQAILNTLTLPPAAADELAGMVHFQIAKELPFPLDSAQVDFVATPAGEEQVRVLVAAARNDVVEFFREVARCAGLQLERIGLRPYANLVAVTEALPETRTGRTLFVDVGPILTEIDVIRDGELVFSRAASVNVPPPGVDLSDTSHRSGIFESIVEDGLSGTGAGEPTSAVEATDVEERRPSTRRVLKDLLVEITRSIEAYRYATDPGGTIDRIVIAGSCNIENLLAEAAHRRFKTPAEVFDPGRTLDLHGEIRTPLVSFNAAIGLMLAHREPRERVFDFLHPKRPEEAQREAARRRPVFVAAAVIVAAVGIAWLVRTHRALDAELAHLRRQSRELKQQVEALHDFRKIVEAARQELDRDIIWIDELRRLAATLPDNRELFLTSLSADGRGRVQIKLRSREPDAHTQLAMALHSPPADDPAPSRYVAIPGGSELRPSRQAPGYDHVSTLTVRVEPGAARPVRYESPQAPRVRSEAGAEAKGTEVGEAGKVATAASSEEHSAAGRGETEPGAGEKTDGGAAARPAGESSSGATATRPASPRRPASQQQREALQRRLKEGLKKGPPPRVAPHRKREAPPPRGTRRP